jgi:hypothetical protein
MTDMKIIVFETDVSGRGYEDKISEIGKRLNWTDGERREYTGEFVARFVSIYKKTFKANDLRSVICDMRADGYGLAATVLFHNMSAITPVISVNVKARLILVDCNSVTSSYNPRIIYNFQGDLFDRELFDSLTEPTSVYEFADMCRERWGRRKEAIAELEEREEFKDFERRLKELKT